MQGFMAQLQSHSGGAGHEPCPVGAQPRDGLCWSPLVTVSYCLCRRNHRWCPLFNMGSRYQLAFPVTVGEAPLPPQPRQHLLLLALSIFAIPTGVRSHVPVFGWESPWWWGRVRRVTDPKEGMDGREHWVLCANKKSWSRTSNTNDVGLLT